MKSKEEIQAMIDEMKQDIENRKENYTPPTWVYMSSSYKLDEAIPINVIEIKIKLLVNLILLF